MIKLLHENKVKLDVKVPKLRDENEQHIILTVSDINGTLESMLQKILKLASSGHSFNVTVDLGSDNEEKFFIDGDGSDKIYDITVEEYKEESDENEKGK